MSLIYLRARAFFGLLLFITMTNGWGASGPFLQMHKNYFWDPQTQEYFIARGIAYQLWNPPVGANQSFEQLTYDLEEFKKNYMNSVRCEMVWGELEKAPGVYDWSRPDYLVAEAERLGLKLFVLIGFQYPPSWFPKELRGINAIGLKPSVMQCLATSSPANALDCFPPLTKQLLENAIPAEWTTTVQDSLVAGAQEGSVTNVLNRLQAGLPVAIFNSVSALLISDVLNYEHPEARALYTRHLAAVTSRYKDSPAIGAWIMGNEYAYFDLWEDPKLFARHRFLGFDTISQQKFQQFLATVHTNIATLNQKWGTSYSNFASVVMPEEFPVNRDDPAYFDLIQWRKKSVGDFVALGAAAARASDPNHLLTYSMVGGVFNGLDENNACEDAKTIVASCKAAGVPLDFWAINNYANAAVGGDLRTADFGIGKYRSESGLPIMISETGHSSTETGFDFPDSGKRQAKAIPGQLWESLVSGCIGTHLFHWNDRNLYTEDYFLRERGFGITTQERLPKPGVYTNVMNMFRRMKEIGIENLLGGSTNPPPDVQIFWTTNSDLVWPTANIENAMLWGAMHRVGYRLSILDDAGYEAGGFTNAPVLLLSRAFAMKPQHLQDIQTRVLPRGIHVHGNADLPGQFDQYSHPNPNWNNLMSSIFGVNSANAYRGFHLIGTNRDYSVVTFQGVRTLGPLLSTLFESVATWEIWHGVGVTDGTVITRHTGTNGSQSPMPALVTKTHGAGAGRTALNTFSLGDTARGGDPKESIWDFRSQWIKAIYGSHFGVQPAIRMTGVGANYVSPDYRICRNGSIVMAFLNGGTNNASITVTATSLLQGKTIENLTQGGILERASDGVFNLAMQGDDYVLLYAYNESGAQSSLVQSGPSRVWFEDAPVLVHPRASTYPVSLGYDTEGANLQLAVSFEDANGKVLSRSTPVSVTGKTKQQVGISIPDADINNPTYNSSRDGGAYFLRATLSNGSAVTSDSYVPVQLAWAVRPKTPLPVSPAPGSTYEVRLEWEDLPSADPTDPTPFDRVFLWDKVNATNDGYAIILNLNGPGGLVASNFVVTRSGTGNEVVSVTVPSNAQGPFTWSAEARPISSLLTHDVFDSFEDRQRGARWPNDLDKDFVAPWVSFNYAANGQNLWQNEGVQLAGSHGSQSAFLVMGNPPGLAFSGFGFAYPYAEVWALPEDPAQWTNWSFSFDFRENNGYACDLIMQVKNPSTQPPSNKWLQYVTPYTPGPDGWAHVSAPLSQFLPQDFDRTQVKELVIGVAMKQESVQYVGAFDNIRFDGPDQVTALGPVVGGYSTANDSSGYLTVERLSTGVIRISWTGDGALETTQALPSAQWEPVLPAVSPKEYPISQAPRFFRLKR